MLALHPYPSTDGVAAANKSGRRVNKHLGVASETDNLTLKAIPEPLRLTASILRAKSTRTFVSGFKYSSLLACDSFQTNPLRIPTYTYLRMYVHNTTGYAPWKCLFFTKALLRKRTPLRYSVERRLLSPFTSLTSRLFVGVCYGTADAESSGSRSRPMKIESCTTVRDFQAPYAFLFYFFFADAQFLVASTLRSWCFYYYSFTLLFRVRLFEIVLFKSTRFLCDENRTPQRITWFLMGM